MWHSYDLGFVQAVVCHQIHGFIIVLSIQKQWNGVYSVAGQTQRVSFQWLFMVISNDRPPLQVATGVKPHIVWYLRIASRWPPQFSVGILTTPSTIVVSPTQQLTKFSVNFVIAISPIDLGAP